MVTSERDLEIPEGLFNDLANIPPVATVTEPSELRRFADIATQKLEEYCKGFVPISTRSNTIFGTAEDYIVHNVLLTGLAADLYRFLSLYVTKTPKAKGERIEISCDILCPYQQFFVLPKEKCKRPHVGPFSIRSKYAEEDFRSKKDDRLCQEPSEEPRKEEDNLVEEVAVYFADIMIVDGIDKCTREQIATTLQCTEYREINVTVPSTQIKAKWTKDCALFALAFAMSICAG
uniref:Uncharacterized protein n=1 Tax=Amphimedon queenslandica TaxID=400682 RepID=A0A1X7V202_AMPQE